MRTECPQKRTIIQGRENHGTERNCEQPKKGRELLRVRVINRTVIPGFSEMVIWGEVQGIAEGLEVVLEPVTLAQPTLRAGRTLVKVVEGRVPVRLVNLSDRDEVMDRKEELAQVALVATEKQSKVCRVITRTPGLDGALISQIKEKTQHLSEERRAQVEALLKEYYHLMYEEGKTGLGGARGVSHRIVTGDATPIYKRPYKVPHALRPEVERQIRKMKEEGVITDSDSPWSAPVVLVPKKSTDGETKYRFCTDFRALNQVTKVPVYPIPNITETLESMGKARYFSTLDLASGYHQIPMDPVDKEKTAFSTFLGHYEYTRMPFGLAGAPATFQRFMDRVLAGIKGDECYVYLDDVVIFGKTFEEHLIRLRNVLSCLRAAQLKIQLEKCHFVVNEVAYLGHVVGRDGVRPDPKTVEAIRTYPVPKNPKEVQKFLGLAGWYRRFIPDYATKAKPLTELTRKDQTFKWEAAQEQAFQTLTGYLCSDSVLIYPDFSEPFLLATDASGVAVGAVLSQKREGYDRPIAYASRGLNAAERNYTVTEQELLAVVWAIKQFRCYLYGRRFTLITDHAALRWMLSIKDPSSRLTRWALRLEEYDYDVIHRPGKLHKNADALSRVSLPSPVQDSQVNGVRIILGESLKDQWQEEQNKDPACLLWEKQGRAYRSEDGTLYVRSSTKGYNDQLVVPRGRVTGVIRVNHDLPTAGHRGIQGTLARIQLRYVWNHMERDVTEYVRTCHVCAETKTPTRLAAPVQPHMLPTRPFQIIALDIVGRLPRTLRGNEYILTVMDHYSRYVEAIPLPSQRAARVTRALVDEVFSRHGIPEVVLTDQGRNFTSGVVQELCRKLNIKKVQTTAYHPEANGRLERVHRTLVTMMKPWLRPDGRNWDEWLPFALMAYRGGPHRGTGFTPNLLTYGREINTLEEMVNQREDSQPEMWERLRSMHDRLEVIHQRAVEESVKSTTASRLQRNRGRLLRDLRIGDQVYVHSPALQANAARKFHKPWKGPYAIVSKVSDVVFGIRWTPNKVVHVHLNRLKKVCGRETDSQVLLKEHKGDLLQAPSSHIIAHCISADGKMSRGVAKQIKQRYPRHKLERVGTSRVGDVTIQYHPDRVIMHLITKARYYDKPTISSLSSCIRKMKNLAQENGFTDIAVPRLGCGLDGMVWSQVRKELEKAFQGTPIMIHVYTPEIPCVDTTLSQGRDEDDFGAGNLDAYETAEEDGDAEQSMTPWWEEASLPRPEESPREESTATHPEWNDEDPEYETPCQEHSLIPEPEEAQRERGTSAPLMEPSPSTNGVRKIEPASSPGQFSMEASSPVTLEEAEKTLETGETSPVRRELVEKSERGLVEEPEREYNRDRTVTPVESTIGLGEPSTQDAGRESRNSGAVEQTTPSRGEVLTPRPFYPLPGTSTTPSLSPGTSTGEGIPCGRGEGRGETRRRGPGRPPKNRGRVWNFQLRRRK